MQNRDVPRLANHVLHLILIAFLLILTRVWHLCIIKHDAYLERARSPQRKVLIEPPLRGTIRDRFNLPLAINKMDLSVAICYDRIREIPFAIWEKNQNGKKVRVYKRRRYVERLSKFLGKHLEMDPIKIEDLIHSQASIFPNTPFVIKDGLSEEVYSCLRFFEKDWIGLKAQRGEKRFYPQGKVGSNIVGYMGAINQRQYFAIAREIQTLQEFIEKREKGLPVILPKGFKNIQSVQLRYHELKERVYTIHTQVGKMGIEAVFDENLRGLYGKKEIEIGANGRFIRNLPGKSQSVSGERILLTVSSELQEFAESLLIQNEKERKAHFPLAGKNHDQIAPPWIQGGAIVALIPQTGEVLALASYPRFDPNDFILQNNRAIHRWLETKKHLSNIWNGKIPLSREFFSYGAKGSYEEKTFLDLDLYFDQTLSRFGKVKEKIKEIRSLEEGIQVMRLMSALMKIGQTEEIYPILEALYPTSEGHTPSHLKLSDEKQQEIQLRLNQEVIPLIKKDLDPYLRPIKHNDDKLLFFDLLHLVIQEDAFTDKLIEHVGKDSLSTYQKLCQACANVEEEVQNQVRTIYHEYIFPDWRKEHFKAFLKEKREEEKRQKTYQHPYTDYLYEAEKKLFSQFWSSYREDFFTMFLFGTTAQNPQLKRFSFHLLMKRRVLEKEGGVLFDHFKQLSERLKKLPQKIALAYLRTMRSFSKLTAPLWGHYYQFAKPHQEQTLQDLALFFYPKNGMGYLKSYAYGQEAALGSLFKPVTGYEALKQRALSYEKANVLHRDLNPLTLYDEMHPQIITDRGMVLGKTLNGKWITRYYKGGRLPRSHTTIGKVDFLSAMERSSNIYFSILAGDVIDHPISLYQTTCELGFGQPTGIELTGEIGGHVPDDIRDNRTGLYAFAIGQHSLTVTPLQTALMLSAFANGGEVLKPQIVKLTAGASFLISSDRLFDSSLYPYQDALAATGIYFPFFTETQKIREKAKITPFKKEVKRTIFYPKEVRDKLFESLYRVVWGDKGPAQPQRIRSLFQHPRLIRDYKSLKGQFIGKTSTAEFVYRKALDREMPPLICKDIWFGAISFKEDGEKAFYPSFKDPELVVVVYLRYGDYGKEAAPLVAQMIKKWREIGKRERQTSDF